MSGSIVCLLLAWSLQAQPQYYRFSIDQDAFSGPPDFSSLNHPLTPADRLFVRNGRFYRVGPDRRPNTPDDEPVRLYGVNLAFSANFPAPEDAVRIAKRLRRIGVNLVRMHHMDSQPDANPANAASLLTTGPYPTLNPQSVTRLRAFLDALAAEGIHVNLNLHVGYQFRPAIDGIPGMEPQIPTQSKPLHIFYPRMVEMQTEFTRKVIAALSLRGDPVLAMVEIDNESSLIWEWQVTNLDTRLNGAYLEELSRQWNVRLTKQYGATEALRRGWTPRVNDGPQLLGTSWTAELHTPARADLRVSDQPSGQLLDVTFRQGGAAIIIKQVGFSVTTGKTYLAEVEMRAELADGVSRPVYWDVKQDISPWRTATGRTVSVTNQWQRYSMLVEPQFSMEGIGRFGLSVENVGANMQIRGPSFHEAGERGLTPSENLEDGAVQLVKTTEFSSPGRRNDFLDFLIEADRAYLRSMLSAIRESTDDLAPVAGTQIGFGGLATIDSHRDLDYHDNHFYIDHYNFPNVAWDGRDWRIRDSSAVGSGLSPILNLAAARPAGRPYTVSEYNQNWPNQQAAEIDPVVAVIGAFQDWDSVMHFAYSHGRNWDDGVPNGFNLNGDWTKFAVLGQSAWLFRSGAIAAGVQPVDVPVPRDLRIRALAERRNGGGIASFFNAVYGYQPLVAIEHPVRLVDRPGELPATARQPKGGLIRADTEEFQYDSESRVFFVHSPWAAGVIGFVGQKEADAGPLTLQLAESARGFAVVLLTPIDGKPLAESRRMLLSLPGQTLRTQPGADEPQKLVNYPGTTDWWTLEREPGFNKPSGNMNGGQRPTYFERVECFVTLRASASRMIVYPLNGSGERMSALEASSIPNGFRIHLQDEGQYFSPWYEIVLE
ncbi:MAG: hypothetical protein HY235_01755 [Acidobacteria bacterium]|nr:hypothetical protein [Acidobacteriota bacterium]